MNARAGNLALLDLQNASHKASRTALNEAPRDAMDGAAQVAVRSDAQSEAQTVVQAAPRHAAALAYAVAERQGGRAPRVTAKGSGLVADEIIERARAAGVPIHESRELVSLLMQVDLDQHIPPVLYIAVAEVLAWVYHLERGAAQGSAS